MNIVILTGAGVSAESGIRTFRAADGLWENHRIEDVATPAGFARDPDLVQRFYNERRRQLKDEHVRPNAAHAALARLDQDWSGELLLVTQNVDDLHERAGSRRMVHLHGELNRALCTACHARPEWREDLGAGTRCPSCGVVGRLRPDVVWFGEMPRHLDEIDEALRAADLFLAIGTSGLVYPAAGFANEARRARRIEVNLAGTDVSTTFHEHRVGPAGREVPRLVDELLAAVK